jgi:glycosyltransferase involved in cell wall biosynthesis
VPSPASKAGGLNLLVTVTFNANQLRAHLLPILSLPEVERVTLVADRLPPELPKLRAVVPPAWLVRIAGRAGAKLLVCTALALRDRPDWVIGFNFVPHGFNALVSARVARSRSLYHMIGGPREWVGGGWTSENSVLGRLPRPVPRLERLLLWLIGRCMRVATMGESGRQLLLERGVAPERVVVVPPSIDTARFSPDPRDDVRWDLLSICALSELKRPFDLLQSVARLRARDRSVRAAIAGDGPLEPELRRRIDELGLGDAVELLGFRDDVDVLCSRSAVFVHTSEYEGLPVAMLEAMGSGLPVVVTAVGEISAFVRDGETGILFATGDVDGLTEALDRLLGDPELRRRIGEAAAADVAARVSIEAVADVYRGVFGLTVGTDRVATGGSR